MMGPYVHLHSEDIPNPITVPVTPIINLTEKEIENVNIFVKLHKINDFKHVILFENSPGSNQSPVNNNFTMNLSKKIVENFEDSLIIISSHKKITSRP